MTALMQQIIELLVSGITGIAEGVGSGLTTLAKAIFVTSSGETTTLSIFGGLVVIFAGISLAIGLCRWVVDWVASLGSRNR